jgi:hypothetical protein
VNDQENKGRNIALWLIAGAVIALFWIAVLNGFAAGVFVSLTLIVATLGAYFSWID